ncbi:MAG: PAS domain S-box protein [Deltaproteobacteria bacterium]|jgi:PAS domain S-box-containing protein|nr:PAS domain S-box protein [Deltaproteobacteria bacterium]
MIISSLPIWIVDMVGSILMIVFSFLCLSLVRTLRNRDQSNVIWTYLFWVCLGLAGFAISRSAGHILKQILVLSGFEAIWSSIRPYSGAINSLMFVFVASVTLFFERIWKIYQQISKDKQTLQKVSDELRFLNQNLENLVAERTRELAVSEHKYRRIFEVSRDMILVTQPDGAIINLNPAGCKLLGYKELPPSFSRKSFADFFVKAADWRKIRETIEHHSFISNAEVSLKDTDGKQIRVLVSGSLDRGFSDRDASIHFLVKDIEQRRIVEEQIAQADKLASIGQLSAGIAHEINNPLGIILGYTQLLIRNEKPGTEKFDDLKTIEKHVRNCKSIVEDLLNFARSSKPNEDVIRVDDALEDVLNFMQQHAGLDNIRVERNFDKTVPDMRLDEKKIKQVFVNLIMNAKHAIGEKGSLVISTSYHPDEGNVIVKISDSGHGIEKKDLARIFDPFFTTKPTGEGTGLGLSVSYGIVKNHGGDILVESEVGQGSTFTVVLPLVSPHSRLAHAKIHSYN